MMFCVLNSWRYPVPRTHYLHVQKLAAGFIQLGYHFKELKSHNELQHLGPQDIVYISNHYGTEITHRWLSKNLTRHLLDIVEKATCRLILWNFHTSPDWRESLQLSRRVLHIGEYMFAEQVCIEPVLHEFRKTHAVMELRYSSPVLPSTTFERRSATPVYDCNFIGSDYQRAWTSHCQNRYKSLIRKTPPIVPEGLRWNSFRESVVNLVFHAPANIRKGIIVERFAEALSLGGLIAHDHPRIKTNYGDRPGFRFVASVAGLDEAIQECKSMPPEEEQEARQRNYDMWVVAGLSYRDQAARIAAAFEGGNI